MSSVKSANKKCPKCCPKQCSNCLTTVNIPANIPRLLMEGMVEAAAAEKAGVAVLEAKTPSNALQCDKLGIGGYMKSGECKQIPVTIAVATQLLKNWYTDASYETEDAFYDVRCIWNSTDDELSRKLSATNRLFIYYLLILAMYIIQISFLIDEKLFEGLCKIINSIQK